MSGLFEQITAKIVTALEDGAGEYRMPWNREQPLSMPSNAVTGRSYRGINTLLLWAEACRVGYPTGTWATYRQWNERGAQVRKGERATTVILWKPSAQSPANNDDIVTCKRGFLARAFSVFNAGQVEGYIAETPPELTNSARIERAEAFFSNHHAPIWHGGDHAFYDPSSDMVSVPAFERFRSAEAFYSVLAHELTHWTGAKARLDRNLSGRFGSEAYAMEELIAELGAAFIAGHLSLGCEPRVDHAPYIASWLRVLGSDPRAIVTAASRAQAAADFLIAMSIRSAGARDQARTTQPDLVDAAV